MRITPKELLELTERDAKRINDEPTSPVERKRWREQLRRDAGQAQTIPKRCESCGKAFMAWRATNRFCSRACAVVGRSGPTRKSAVMRECRYCGKRFPSPPSRIAKGEARYCSVACRSVHWRAIGRFRASANPNHKGGPKPAICPTCGIEFSYYGKRPRKFCSAKCLRHVNLSKKGLRAEYRARDCLTTLGYVVARSAGSHGAFDLVALKGSECLLVQVKCGKPVSQPEVAFRSDLERLQALDVEAKRELWLWIDHQGWFILGWDGATWRPGIVKTAAAPSSRSPLRRRGARRET